MEYPPFVSFFYFIVINYYSLCLQLKEECTEALERVFKVRREREREREGGREKKESISCIFLPLQICDVDNDGLLNDQELNDFQVSVAHLASPT